MRCIRDEKGRFATHNWVNQFEEGKAKINDKIICLRCAAVLIIKTNLDACICNHPIKFDFAGILPECNEILEDLPVIQYGIH